MTGTLIKRSVGEIMGDSHEGVEQPNWAQEQPAPSEAAPAEVTTAYSGDAFPEGKTFLGGLAYESTEESIRAYFDQNFGSVCFMSCA